MKFSIVFSPVNPKKKMMEVATEIQHKVIRFLRFIVRFLVPKISYLAGIGNYFFPNGCFLELSGMEKTFCKRRFYIHPELFRRAA
jgi:hypothetical protein